MHRNILIKLAQRFHTLHVHVYAHIFVRYHLSTAELMFKARAQKFVELLSLLNERIATKVEFHSFNFLINYAKQIQYIESYIQYY